MLIYSNREKIDSSSGVTHIATSLLPKFINKFEF